MLTPVRAQSRRLEGSLAPGGMAPERIVYVSCDPATLARDVDRFVQLGYRPVRAQGVDLFPRTVHVETICLLSKPDLLK